jgi:hypothetical protein
METHIFLLCYNESALLPHTIAHYRRYLPSCHITIYDNESTDNSVEIAKSLGCKIVSWSSGNIIDDFKYIDIKNNCWKSVEKGWIIVGDMDEFLCVTEEELSEEEKKGTNMLTVRGYDMIGESSRIDLVDIDLQGIRKYRENNWENKYLCFRREKIEEMNYNLGAHFCDPRPRDSGLIYSENAYWNKHMNYLGLPYYMNKILGRYERSELMRSKDLDIQYTNDIDLITRRYYWVLENSISL